MKVCIGGLYCGGYKGVMTLTLLLLFSAALVLFMLFDDEQLRLYQGINAQRQLFVQQSLALQNISRQQKESLCAQLSLDNDLNTQQIVFERGVQADRLSQYMWCGRQRLFKQAPKKGISAGEYAQLIQSESLPHFKTELTLPPAVLPKKLSDTLYWFDATQTEWELKGNVRGIVVAEGDLHISGKGKISGALITGGKLTLAESVTVSYRKSTVTKLVRRYSRWRLEEKSWYDFKPL
ncbi:DUF2572 family protein [Actinobacillus seminis]|uniref:DUF2572 family protein n=1 Tax=Actinobacillus seminis TaxID=722 RepID=UPI003B930CBA